MLFLALVLVFFFSNARQGRFSLNISRQQQQLERVKKWLQLRNRDSDHRAQVEQRRRQIEEENRVRSINMLMTFLCAFFSIFV